MMAVGPGRASLALLDTDPDPLAGRDAEPCERRAVGDRLVRAVGSGAATGEKPRAVDRLASPRDPGFTSTFTQVETSAPLRE